MHYQLRTEGSSAASTAAAIGLGTLIGCTPLYGAHVVICVVLARLLGLSRIKTYLAAHINNPLSAPLLLFAELHVGHLAITGKALPLSLVQLRQAPVLDLGRDLLVGSLIVGLVLGSVFAAVTFLLCRRRGPDPLPTLLVEETSRKFLGAGVFSWEFVRGKLRFDPMYMAIVRDGLLPPAGRIYDLGCGRGLLPALIETAREIHARGRWDEDWAKPPDRLDWVGVESRRRAAAAARLALRGIARILNEDVGAFRPEPAAGILLLDVLHYLPPEVQETVVRRAAEALRPGGALLIREPDAEAGWRFWMTRAAERLASWARWKPGQRLSYRASRDWAELLASHGLEVRLRPLSGGTPYANVLIEGRKA